MAATESIAIITICGIKRFIYFINFGLIFALHRPLEAGCELGIRHYQSLKVIGLFHAPQFFNSQFCFKIVYIHISFVLNPFLLFSIFG